MRNQGIKGIDNNDSNQMLPKSQSRIEKKFVIVTDHKIMKLDSTR